MSKITPTLWYDGTAEEAANFYVTLLPDSRIEAEHQRGSARQSPKDRPRRAGRRRRLSRRHLHRRDAARLPAGQCHERGLDGVFLSVKYAVPAMRRPGSGSIISYHVVGCRSQGIGRSGRLLRHERRRAPFAKLNRLVRSRDSLRGTGDDRCLAEP